MGKSMFPFLKSMRSRDERAYIKTAGIMLAFLSRLFAADDAEWRQRTGVDPGRGPVAATVKLTPDAVPGLLLWLDTTRGVVLDDNGRVERWEDQSGCGNHLAQPDVSLRVTAKVAALNSLSVLAFSGFHGHHTETFARGVVGDLELGSRGVTVLAVLQQREEILAAALFKYGPDNHRRGLGIGLNDFGTWVDPPQEYGGTLGGGGQLVGAGFQVLAPRVDFAAGVAEIFRNSQRVGRVERAGGFQVEPKGRFQLGGSRVAHTNCAVSCGSDLAEFLVFDRALTDTELTSIEAWLRAKWGLDRLQKNITPLAALLPFAYYPSVGEIELAFDKSAPLLSEYFGDAPRPAANPDKLTPGLLWATYPDGKLPNDWGKAVPKKAGTVADLDLPNAAFDPPANTAYAISGWLNVPRTGVYTFVLRPQSASVLQIDGVVVADQSGSKDTWGTWNWKGGAVALAAGWHRLHVRGLAQPQRLEHEKLPLVLCSGPGFWRKPIVAASLANDGAMAPPLLETVQARPMPAALAQLAEAPFRVVESHSGRQVAAGVLKLDAAGRGQARFKLGDLPDGEYAVEYNLAGIPVRLPQTFTRIKFPWEDNTLGKDHEVFPPFTPVQVKGTSVSIVDRVYRINALGMFDSCQSQGRELLTSPMTAVVRAGGKELAWTMETVAGKVLFPDLAEFASSAQTEAFQLAVKTAVEEDGCCRVEWTLMPGAKPAQIEWLELVIPLKESEAPLFGWSAQDSMRHHYWGLVPPAGNIVWDTEQDKAPAWVPAVWSLGKGGPPPDGRVWDSARNRHWTPGNRDPFVCYVWLGSEERGLAWFADRPGQFAGPPDQPRQIVCREPGRVTLRVRVIQQPTLIREPCKLVFGLQASPTKPLRPDWRTHPVPGGGGLPVVPWGGYYCSSKYPDNRDFAVVDQIMRMATEFSEEDEARRRSEKKPSLEDEIKAELKKIDSQRLWKDLKLFGSEDWYGSTLMYFVSQARWKKCCAYVEEHAH